MLLFADTVSGAEQCAVVCTGWLFVV